MGFLDQITDVFTARPQRFGELHRLCEPQGYRFRQHVSDPRTWRCSALRSMA